MDSTRGNSRGDRRRKPGAFSEPNFLVIRKALSQTKSIHVRLAPPTGADRERFLESVHASRALHAPWVAPPSTAAEFDDYLVRLAREDHAGYLIRPRGALEIAGVVNLNNIVRGAFRSAYLGYYAMVPFGGAGYMKRGLRLALRVAFGELALHRVEANIQPGNQASIALVRSLGFRKEGFSPKYLMIDGAWRDHERWALLSDAFERA